jgi:hypothetical protein
MTSLEKGRIGFAPAEASQGWGPGFHRAPMATADRTTTAAIMQRPATTVAATTGGGTMATLDPITVADITAIVALITVGCTRNIASPPQRAGFCRAEPLQREDEADHHTATLKDLP